MDFPLPPVGEGLFEVELVRWLVKPGEAVGRGQPLMEVMSDKATMEVPAPFAGTVTETVADAGNKIQVGEVVLRYEAGEAKNLTPLPPLRSGEGEPDKKALPFLSASERRRGGEVSSARTTVAAAPSVRQLARKLGVDLARVSGSGPGGRVLIDDLSAFLKPAKPATSTHPGRTLAPQLDLGTAGTTAKLVGLRRRIAERMVASKRAIPHYSYIDECDFTSLVKLRTELRDPFARAGVKLTYLAFVVKAVARALKDVPAVNATFDDATETLTLHARYHVGVAVAAPAGLMVPVVKDADQKDIAAIAADIDRLSADARTGKIKADDLRGGTFTVTSVGNVGGLISTPIINHPEVGILGLGKVVKRPVFDATGNVVPAEVAYLSFSFDHRVVDGAVGATFGNAVLKHLLAPATLLLPDRFAQG